MAQNDEANYLTQINTFKEEIISESESLVLKTFPRKAIELHNLLQSSKFNLKNLEQIRSEINIPIPEYPYVTEQTNHVDGETSDESRNGPPLKKRKFVATNHSDGVVDGVSKSGDAVDGSRVLILPYGSVPCNKYISELIDQVKPLIRQLVDDTNMLKMWILFLIPRIEDGNNFGVSIQEDILGEIRTVEVEATTYFDQVSRYFLNRAKIVTKIAKYPHVDDFRRNVSEIDEKEFLSLRLVVAELRNHYASLHDLVTKNLEKIKRPRTFNSHETMY